MRRRAAVAGLWGCLLVMSTAAAQPDGFNYDETKVPEYRLPNPLMTESGEPVTSADEWWSTRRPEILHLFEEHVYGRTPTGRTSIRTRVLEVGPGLGGKAVRRQVRLFFSDQESPYLDLLMWLPANSDGPAPAFIGLNFRGNQSTTDDPHVMITESWVRAGDGVEDHRATEATRGAAKSRWPAELIIDRGCALVTAYYGDIDPDFDDGFQNGVQPLFYAEGQEGPAPNEWGSIGAWAWGLSRALDYLQADEAIDPDRVALMGHSRLGKTALWAGALDDRFSIVISNNSGCGGAALNRRRFGETVERINTSFPHWFNDNFNRFNGQEDQLPVDQHQLVALIAPRPVLICSAEEDRWADPRGEFLSGFHAGPVYELLGTDGIGTEQMPGLSEPILTTVGYHIRPGGHDVKDQDWRVYMDFAERHWNADNR